MFRRIWPTILLLCVASFACAQRAPEVAPTALTRTFAETCMQHFYEPGLLRDLMRAQEVPVLPAEQARVFLREHAGIAWALQVGDEKLIIARRDDGMCTVFARSVPVEQARSHFAALVSQAPEPLKSRLVKDGSDAGPDTRLLTYAWQRPADRTELMFSFSADLREAAPVRAMVSMAMVPGR